MTGRPVTERDVAVCEKKRRWVIEANAVAAAARINDIRGERDAHLVTTYRCRVCGWWHHTHADPANKSKRRRKQHGRDHEKRTRRAGRPQLDETFDDL